MNIVVNEISNRKIIFDDIEKIVDRGCTIVFSDSYGFCVVEKKSDVENIVIEIK